MDDAVKYGPSIQLQMVDGVPQCPCHGIDMVSEGPNVWRCVVAAEMWKALRGVVRNAAANPTQREGSDTP